MTMLAAIWLASAFAVFTLTGPWGLVGFIILTVVLAAIANN